MDDRLKRIVAILRESGDISPDQLAACVGVSTRTIRTYIARLNDMLGDQARIEMKNAPRYRLTDADKAVLEKVTEHGLLCGAGESGSPRGRIDVLMSLLLIRSSWVIIDELAKELYVSRTTAAEDLKRAVSYFDIFNLVIERKPHHGICVSGNESDRRRCLASLLLESGFGERSAFGISIEDVSSIESSLREAAEHADFRLNSAAFRNLLVHVVAGVLRAKFDSPAPVDNDTLATIRNSREYRVASVASQFISERLNVRLPDQEVAYIAIHLAGRQRLDNAAGQPIDSIVISDEVWSFVTMMVERIWQLFRFDFRDDLELRMTLAQHMVPLSVRLRFKMRIENPLLTDIKSCYPLAWAMAVEASSVPEDAFGAVLSEEEKGYLALDFAYALERHAHGGKRKSILIVCASGAGSAKLLEHRYRREFGAYLECIKTCDVASVSHIDFSNIDYVFTTVPLGRKLPVPIREVGFFLDDSDILTVREALSHNTSEKLPSYFDRRLFLSHFDATDKVSALDALCELASHVANVPESFRELVEEREKAGATTFGNRVAMPHPMVACSQRTFVVVALLEQPISWAPNVNIEAIFLVSVSRGGDDSLQDFYDRMARLLTSAEAVDELISQRSFEALLDQWNR